MLRQKACHAIQESLRLMMWDVNNDQGQRKSTCLLSGLANIYHQYGGRVGDWHNDFGRYQHSKKYFGIVKTILALGKGQSEDKERMRLGSGRTFLHLTYGCRREMMLLSIAWGKCTSAN